MPWKNEIEDTISNPYNNPIFLIVRICLFILSFPYLLGQLYFYTFEIHSTISGVTGITASILSSHRFLNSLYIKRIIITCCLLAIASILYAAYIYYTTTHAQGSYFGWQIHGVYISTILIVMFKSLTTPNK